MFCIATGALFSVTSKPLTLFLVSMLVAQLLSECYFILNPSRFEFTTSIAGLMHRPLSVVCIMHLIFWCITFIWSTVVQSSTNLLSSLTAFKMSSHEYLIKNSNFPTPEVRLLIEVLYRMLQVGWMEFLPVFHAHLPSSALSLVRWSSLDYLLFPICNRHALSNHLCLRNPTFSLDFLCFYQHLLLCHRTSNHLPNLTTLLWLFLSCNTSMGQPNFACAEWFS